MMERRTCSWATAAIIVILTAVSARADEPPDLLHVMQQLGLDLTRISDGMLTENYAAVATAAAAIADHPKPPLAQRKKIIAGLGADAGRFRLGDQVVHDAALAVKDAARLKDNKLVLQRYVELVEGCMSCHTSFRERVRALNTN